MPVVHTLLGAVPPARSDGIPWSLARIQEAEIEIGPWVEVEAMALDPLDVDPADPMERDFTFTGELDTGWYRIIWEDEDINSSPPTDPIYDSVVTEAITEEWLPQVTQVAALLRARTKGVVNNLDGEEVGTFNDTTRPTGNQVETLIRMAAGLLVRCTGPWLPESLHSLSRTVVALRAAMLVELSYWPEQIESEQSAYEHIRDLYLEVQPTLCELATGSVPDDIPDPNEGATPLYYFGDGAYGWPPSLDGAYIPDNETYVMYGERPVIWWMAT